MRVYLSGPITGQSESEISTWRRSAIEKLRLFAEVTDPAAYEFDVTIPRAENMTRKLKRLQHGIYVDHRNKVLIRNCDVVLAYFLGAHRRVSIGSIGEIFWADAFGKPVIVVREPRGNIHDHAMVNGLAARICHTLDEAVDAISELAGTLDRKRVG